MLPFGHLSASYLIASTSKKPLKIKELFFILFCGNIFDLDYPALVLSGISGSIHHNLPTHTPALGLLYFLVLYLFLKNEFSKKVFFLGALAMLSHLILDTPSSINFLWPFVPMASPQQHLYTLTLPQVVYQYSHTLMFKLEFLLTAIAILLFIKKQSPPLTLTSTSL